MITMTKEQELVEDLLSRFGIAPVEGDATGEARLGRLREALLLGELNGDESKPALSALGSVRAFWAAYRERFTWDLLPGGLLTDAYRSWATREGVTPVNKAAFLTAMEQIVEETADSIWMKSASAKTRPTRRMSGSEPLVDELGLDDWRDGPRVPNYRWCLVRRSDN